jgi:NTP pyrophosphatase (non-canonical NTP hydrolase)
MTPLLTLEIIDAIREELTMARRVYPDFHSGHEAYATLLEEVDELWDAVKMNQRRPERRARMRSEAIQVAAMAIRLIEDCCDRETEA